MNGGPAGRRNAAASTAEPLVVAGGVLGLGLGAALDVVLFHLVLQHHHLVSGIVDPATVAGLRTNMLADGLFLLLATATMAVGVWRLWTLARRPDVAWRADTYAGAVIVGLALFNLFDGVVLHALLNLHHATHPGLDFYDAAWVGISLVLLGAGWYVVRSGDDEPTVSAVDD